MPVFKRSHQLTMAKATSALLLFGFAVAFAADPGSDRVIADCDAVDELSLAECVQLKFEQAEATLIQVEENWQKLLDEEANAAKDATATDNNRISATTAAESNSTTTGQSNVIAIVNDNALQAGVNTGDKPVINIDQSAAIETPVEEELFDTTVDNQERFGFLPALFRSYRDQQCAWQASVFGNDRTQIYYQACLAAMAQSRSTALTHYLTVQRSRARNGQFFRGFYTKIETGALFQSCDRKTNWWVTGAESVLASLDSRYLDIKSESLSNTDLLYAELRGEVVKPNNSNTSIAAATNFSTALSVRSISLLRPVTNNDCEQQSLPGQNTYSPQDTENILTTSTAPTVDDFASSGFLYGYFNYWLAACSVTETSVCSAESDAQFASDGDWQLRVDRSLEGDWRIKLVPTTNDQSIEKQLSMQINGADVFLSTSFDQPMRLTMKQGVVIAEGESARELVTRFKQGRELRFQWFDESDVMSELKFSLQGVTRALEYFDSAKS